MKSILLRLMVHVNVLLLSNVFLVSNSSAAADLDLLTPQQEVVHAELLAAAETRGEIEVMVRLNLEVVPEGLLGASEAFLQTEAIATTGDELMSSLADAPPLSVIRYKHLPWAAMRVTADGLAALLASPATAAVYPEVYYALQAAPKGGDWESSPYDWNYRKLVEAPVTETTREPYGGAGQVIAVLDTGVEYTHPYFENRVVAGACFSNPQQLPPEQATSLCPGGVSEAYGRENAMGCDRRHSGCTHGTQVAGIAAGRDTKYSGVAPDAEIISVVVFTEFNGEPLPYCLRDSCFYAAGGALTQGLDYLYSIKDQYNLAVVNLSIGGGRTTVPVSQPPGRLPDYDAIALLRSAGILTVAASGNDRYSDATSSLAGYDVTVSVGGTRYDDTIGADFTNSAAHMDFWAPGDSVRTAYPLRIDPDWVQQLASGTSMSTPFVTGGYAVMRGLHPDKTIDELVAMLKEMGTPVTDPRNGLTFPRLNLRGIPPMPDLPPKPVKPSVAYDFDGDEKADIFWRRPIDGQAHFYKMNGAAIEAEHPVGGFDLDSYWDTIAVGDFDGDGTEDTLSYSHNSMRRMIHFMEDGQVRDSAYIRDVPDWRWKVVGVGDLNGDDKDDIIWRHLVNGINWVYLMDGAEVIGSHYINTVSDRKWKIVAVADLNGDAKVDIVWRHELTGVVWIYLMDGAKPLASRPFGRVADRNWQLKKTGDLDGDGKEDLIWRNDVTGANWVHLMDGVRPKRSAPMGRVADLNWEIVQVSDFNGDQRADILWRNMETGLNWQYQLNGLQLTNSRPVNLVSDRRWKIVDDRKNRF